MIVGITAVRPDYFFRAALASVACQTVKPGRVIIAVDNDSHMFHQSFEKCIFGSGIARTSEVDLLYLNKKAVRPSGKPGMTKNLILRAASQLNLCSWVFLLDGDDFILPNTLEIYGETVFHSLADIVLEFNSTTLIHTPQGITFNVPQRIEDWRAQFENVMLQMSTASQWTRGNISGRPILIRTDRCKYFPEDYSYVEDRMFIMGYAMEGRPIKVSDYCGYVYNIHSGSISGLDWKESGRENNVYDYNRFKSFCSRTDMVSVPVAAKPMGKFITDSDRDFIKLTVEQFYRPT
jgi:hypothetical protein